MQMNLFETQEVQSTPLIDTPPTRFAGSNFSLLHGDCLRLMLDIEPGTVAACITDPPYGIDYQSSWSVKKKAKIANDTQPYIWWLPHAYKAMKNDSCLVCFARWDVQEIFRMAIECAGFKVKSQVIWDRCIHGMGDLKGNFAPQHDVMWFATKGNFKLPGKRPKSVIRCPRLQGVQLTHPNEKPLELMSELVLALTKPGDIVLDPFTGSGVSGEACIKLDRKFIGCEIDYEHFKTARKRIEVC
jgi:site-specific DNA-methyltransferase (adenine-specific)